MIRLLDIIFSVLALSVLSVVLLPITLLLRFTGEGKILYCQERIGQFGEKFRLIKFATMLEDSPNIGTGTITIEDDPRVLPVGRVLRKTKVNELAQLINVIKGDMSLIGPRPLTAQAYASYEPEVAKQIYSVKPGLSGIGSIIFRDEEKLLQSEQNAQQVYDNIIAPYKAELEMWFCKKRCLKLYLGLIVITAVTIAIPKSVLVWRVFPSLPEPNEDLLELLGLRLPR